MKYRIPPTYYSAVENAMVSEWSKQIDDTFTGTQLDFVSWLKKYAKAHTATGNFEDGWNVEFDDEAHYTWFLLKYGATA